MLKLGGNYPDIGGEFFYISQTFSFFLRHEMTFFAVGWTT